MRGKDPADSVIVEKIRITPAYAGKRIPSVLSDFKHRDHPRLCGEKHQFLHCLQGLLGSPPPMRGKERKSGVHRDSSRITPAYAGKSGINCNQIPVTGDHPRLCGEKDAIMHKIADIAGSPPPMRGKGKSSWRDN